MQTNSKQDIFRSPQKIIKTNSFLQNSTSLQLPEQSDTKNNQTVRKMIQKLNKISRSVDISGLKKNPLNLIEYQMEGEKSRYDPQMILAKLRKLQNRAQIHRVDNQIHLLSQEKSLSKTKTKKSLTQKTPSQQKKRQIKQSYIKIYQSYLKQKQLEAVKKEIYEQDQQQVMGKQDYQDLSPTKNGVKYFNALQKHPKLLDLTLSIKKQQSGLTLLEQKTQKKLQLSEKIKNKSGYQQQFTEQKEFEKQKQSKRYFQNPQQVIQRQITKFYMKKNPGKLTNEAQINQRSQNLIKRQKQINSSIDENKISKQDKKKLQAKLNELANQLAKSDRRKSLQGLLPQLKQTHRASLNSGHNQDVCRKLFCQTYRKKSFKLFPQDKNVQN